MTTEKMTVHKALSELKIIDDRIYKAIHAQAFIFCKKRGSDNVNGVTVQQLSDTMTAAYRKAEDLINRRNAIKRALVHSNAVTTVTIGGKEYTVAEAIDMKQHGMSGWRMLLETIDSQYGERATVADRENAKIEDRADAYIASLFGASDMAKASEEAINTRRVFIDNQTIDLLDPLELVKKHEELEEKIAAFESEVDAALSVSNALTEIEIEY